MKVQFSSVQSLSSGTLCNPIDCSTPDFPVYHQLPELAQAHTHWAGDAIQPSHPLSSPSPAFYLNSIRVFSNESVLRIRWPKYWGFSFRVSPSTEYSVFISFRIDWFVLFAVQGTQESFQHHNSNPSILRCSAFFIVQLSHSYMITGKTIALTRWTFVGKVMLAKLFFQGRFEFHGCSHHLKWFWSPRK